MLITVNLGWKFAYREVDSRSISIVPALSCFTAADGSAPYNDPFGYTLTSISPLLFSPITLANSLADTVMDELSGSGVDKFMVTLHQASLPINANRTVTTNKTTASFFMQSSLS